METHAHDLHKAPGHGWKHYFFEFFMLFLAVFCGFLAENVREHIVEHEREKQYMQSLITDLMSDTSLLNAGFPKKDDRVKAIDSVFLFYETHHDPDRIPAWVLRNMKRTLWDRAYRRNSVTINQLKNAGGMRLIRKKNVADSIASYDLHWERLEFFREAYFTHQQIGSALTEKMFNAYDLLSAYRKNATGSDAFAYPDSAMIRINTAPLNEYLNFLSRQKSFTIQDENNYKSPKEQAERLFDLVKKEYPAE